MSFNTIQGLNDSGGWERKEVYDSDNDSTNSLVAN